MTLEQEVATASYLNKLKVLADLVVDGSISIEKRQKRQSALLKSSRRKSLN